MIIFPLSLSDMIYCGTLFLANYTFMLVFLFEYVHYYFTNGKEKRDHRGLKWQNLKQELLQYKF